MNEPREDAQPPSRGKATVYGVVIPRTPRPISLLDEIRLVALAEREFVRKTDGQLPPVVLRMVYPTTIEVLRFTPAPPRNAWPVFMHALGRTIAMRSANEPEMVILTAEAWITDVIRDGAVNKKYEALVIEGIDRERRTAAILIPILREECGRPALGNSEERRTGVIAGTLEAFWSAYRQRFVERCG